MVVSELEVLSEAERDLVLRAPALITVLISGADGDFDKDEELHASKAVHYKSVQGDPLLMEYYQAIDLDFLSAMRHLHQKYSGTPQERAEKITAKLTQLNDILPKLHHRFARALINDWRNLAKTVARASGGIFGFASISFEESHFVDLEMITFQPPAL
ncbi:MAG: hypothetical protein R2728_16315 [Chitinophagales bacterium]